MLLRLAEHLRASGSPVSFALREASPALMPLLPEGIPCLSWEQLALSPQHCWVVPEGWPNALAPGLHAKATCVVYVQNWAYLLASLPENTFWDQLPVRFLSVSDPVRWFTQQATGLDSPILRPAVDGRLFYPAQGGPADTACAAAPLTATSSSGASSPGASLSGAPLSGTPPSGSFLASCAAPLLGPLRVAWMPRKNPALARQIREIFTARLHRHGLPCAALPNGPVEWVEIHRKNPQEVAQCLRSSHIFLSTGFPEGCPLPPLEAMASGCLVVGFSGMGGWDYMRQAAPEAAQAYGPWWPVRPVPWGGNGFYVADADVTGAALALEQACCLLRAGGPELAAVRAAALQTVAAYSPEAQARQVHHIWKTWGLL